jgi:predicted nucleic acid-binding protein
VLKLIGVKQNASLDASFWINICLAQIVEYLPNYFTTYVPPSVAAEIRYPLDVLGIQAYSAILFNRWVQKKIIFIQEPLTTEGWYQPGENDAIALAKEIRGFLLIDDANPYHRAKSLGLQVVGSAELTIILFDQGRLSYELAIAAIQQTHASKKQKREALIFLEALARRKEQL